MPSGARGVTLDYLQRGGPRGFPLRGRDAWRSPAPRATRGGRGEGGPLGRGRDGGKRMGGPLPPPLHIFARCPPPAAPPDWPPFRCPPAVCPRCHFWPQPGRRFAKSAALGCAFGARARAWPPGERAPLTLEFTVARGRGALSERPQLRVHGATKKRLVSRAGAPSSRANSALTRCRQQENCGGRFFRVGGVM